MIYLSRRLSPLLCPPGVEGGGIILEAGGWFVQIKRRRWGFKPWTWRCSVTEGRCFWMWGPFLVKLPRVSNAQAIVIPYEEVRPDPVITAEQLREAVRRAAEQG